LEWAVNTPELIEAHKKRNGPIVRTRFPPEPNGYLHIGHAKSMNMNFSLAFEKLGVPLENRRTVFRFDRPSHAGQEYTPLKRDLRVWLDTENNPQRDIFLMPTYAVQLKRKGCLRCDMSGSPAKRRKRSNIEHG
jgi:glutaminyl-tRNA synthetase